MYIKIYKYTITFKNKKGSEKGTPYRCSVENMMREKNIKKKAQLKVTGKAFNINMK